MDYLDEDAPKPTAFTGTSPAADDPAAADLELDTELAVPEGTAPVDVDPFLQELLPEDRNSRRRVVTALLRAVLAERKVT